MGRYFDTSSAVATVASSATNRTKNDELSQKTQKTQRVDAGEFGGDNVIDLRHAFEERAAIMEYDGGMPRDQAERLAAMETGFDPDTV